MSAWLALAEGPLFALAVAVFVLGGLWRIRTVLAAGRRRDLSPPKASAAVGFVRGNLRHFVPGAVFAGRTWVHWTGGYAFHVGLAVLLFGAAPHLRFLADAGLALPWPPLPRWGLVVAAEVAFAGLILLWARRISDPVLRQISDLDDHFGVWLTFLVMLTGCFALGESSLGLRALHMTLADLWLIAIPFTRMSHGFTFWLARGFTGATYGRRGITA